MISLDSILNDRTSGSSELLYKLNQYFLQELNRRNDFGKDIDRIEKKLETFTIVRDYFSRIKEYIRHKDFNELENYLKNFDTRERYLFDKLFQNSVAALPRFSTVLTISNSKTLLEFFKYWNSHINRIEIFVCESRPGGEGEIMANNLSANGLKAKVIKDNESETFVNKSDIVFLGADKILRNGSVVNKTGSKNICVMAKNSNIPVFVLTVKNKIEQANDRHILFDTELFEMIDSDMITKIITD